MEALGQRNVERALRQTQRNAVDEHGHPTFPCLHEQDERGRPKPIANGAVPTFHGFRHTAVSLALSAGESAEEISWQLGHKNSVVTRTVYAQEIKSVERKARRRLAMESRYGTTLEAVDGNSPQSPNSANVTELPRRANTAAGRSTRH